MQANYNNYITIIIPTYRRSTSILRLYEELEAQTNKKFKVIIVVDSPEEIYKKEYKRIEQNIKENNYKFIYNAKNIGRNASRAVGIEATDTSFVLFLDDDIKIDPEFIQNYYDLLKDNTTSIICGQIIPKTEESDFEKYLSSSESYFGYKNFSHGSILPFYKLFTANVLLPIQAAQDVNILKDSSLYKNANTYGYEDLILGFELHKQGYTSIFNARSIGIHLEKPTLEGFCQKKFLAGKMVPKIVKTYPDLKKILHFSEVIRIIPFPGFLGKNFYKFLYTLIKIIPSKKIRYFFYRLIITFNFFSGVKQGFSS